MWQRLIAGFSVLALGAVRAVVGADRAGATTYTCTLAAGAAQPTDGPTDTTLYHPSTGTIHGAMVFVDFSDAPASETTTALYDAVVPWAQSWFTEVSYGAVTLAVTPAPTWFRMPKTSTAYGFGDGVTFNEQRAYIADAM